MKQRADEGAGRNRCAARGVRANAEGTRSSVDIGGVFVTITGANVTKSALVTTRDERAFVSQPVALLKFALLELSRFAFGSRALEKWAYGADKPDLSLEQVRALPVALPALVEQYRIVAEVDANLKRAQALRQAVVAKAFALQEGP